MKIIGLVLALLTALEFLYIFYLETVITASEKTAKTFGMSIEELRRNSVNTLFKNQGVYNGLIGILLLVNLLIFKAKTQVLMILALIILVALYGGLTSNPKIILKQGGLAMLALAVIAIFGL